MDAPELYVVVALTIFAMSVAIAAIVVLAWYAVTTLRALWMELRGPGR